MNPKYRPTPQDSPSSISRTIWGGKRCLGFIATVDPKVNPQLRFNAVHCPKQKTPTAIHAAFAAEGKGRPCVTINAGYWWAGNSLSLLITDGVVKSIENQTVERNGQTVYPLRAAFGQMNDGSLQSRWIYCLPSLDDKPYAFRRRSTTTSAPTPTCPRLRPRTTPAPSRGRRAKPSAEVRCWCMKART